MLTIALPNKGSLSDGAVRLFEDAGFHCRRYGRELALRDSENNAEFIFLRPRDIAIYVGNGTLDIGITGRDLAQDSGAPVSEMLPLKFGRSAFHYAAPVDSSLLPDDFSGLRIATSYPGLVHADLTRRRVDARVVRLDGAVEISIRLGVADVIADVVQTGRTLDQAGLKIIGEPIFKSEAVLIAQQPEAAERPDVKLVMDRLNGIVVAREYVMVEYDVESAHLDRACAITPGIESPTVAPLSKSDWVAVKAMARRRDVNPIMDNLAAIGAKGIIVTDIRTCRL